MAGIEIYTQPGCPFCIRAVSLLKQKGVSFKEINAPHGTPERVEARTRSGGRTTVPQIFIDDKAIGGCDDLFALEQSGKLDSLLATVSG
ncbi:MAG: glutaredoxin 3 [Acetobacter sp.]|jgi:glutaredoxin 3|nr:glutaredoxin 3 [Acetobacter sp.]MCH4062244.1 glutaredoxin 3 [Acetobacter sp.]MCH4088909.1 glutaredoxin 3 [Acetobacter sp.]MCI1292812.1 glutaredoxin 3 [Acetobacter sp.]MCI1319087.1 glutaredoxin 3 [Acetobacter sp.]